MLLVVFVVVGVGGLGGRWVYEGTGADCAVLMLAGSIGLVDKRRFVSSSLNVPNKMRLSSVGSSLSSSESATYERRRATC